MAKVLVVDDEKLIVKGIKFSLEQENMEVETAFDGEEALDMLYKSTFDLIISDIMMPGFDGYRLLENVRKLDKLIIYGKNR